FLFFLLGRVLFATKGSSVSLCFLTCLEDLGAVGGYAWGAAMLAHLFYHLSRTSRSKTGINGFAPFLQVQLLPSVFLFDLPCAFHINCSVMTCPFFLIPGLDLQPSFYPPPSPSTEVSVSLRRHCFESPLHGSLGSDCRSSEHVPAAGGGDSRVG